MVWVKFKIHSSMKKLLLLATFIGAGFMVKAQLFYAQGGVNFANITKDNDGNVQDANTLTSFNVGLLFRPGLSEVVDIESGLLLSGHGAKAETYFNGGNDYVKAKFNPLYLQVPLNLVVNIPLQSSTKLFAHAGPYIAMGVGGKSKTETKLGPIETNSSSSIKFNNDDPLTSGQEGAAYDRLKRFDYGANLGAGVQLSGFILKANYGLGLAKINSKQENNSDDQKNKYRTFSISVGIPLGGNN